MKSLFLRFVAAWAIFGIAQAHGADTYPSRPIRLVVGFAAGGPTDVVARILAREMTTSMGQSVVVENKTGANALIATKDVLHAKPDGYSLHFASLSYNVNPILSPEQAGYDPMADFVPVSLVATLPMVTVTAYESPVTSMQDLIKKARAQPKSVSFASPGVGGSGHLAGELLSTLAKAEMTNVPFRGNAPALMEVMSGRVTFMFYPIIGIADYVATKRVKILAVGTASRLAQFPGVPTMAEVGFPGFEETAPWLGMLAPAKTPPAVVKRLNEEILKALAKPEVKESMKNLGGIVVGSSPADFSAYLKQDHDRWERVIKASGIKLD